MFTKASKFQVIPSVFLFFWILLVNVASAVLLPGVETWPMYFVTIFFFVMGGDKKNIATVFGGAATGLVFVWLLCQLMIALTPAMGVFGALVIALCLALGLIIIGGNFCPVLLNNITFAYLTITTIIFDPALILSKVIPWGIMLLIGGGIILGGALVILTVVPRAMQKSAEKKN